MSSPRREPVASGSQPGAPGASPVWGRARHNPWWIPPFLGGVPPLPPRLIRLLGLVSLGMAFEQYDLSLLSSAIRHINEDLSIGLGDSGYYLSAIRMGGLLTFAIVPFADRVGRRRIFLAALVGMSVGTLASGLSQTALQFTLAQFVTRAFLNASVAVAIVILTEEFPAAYRGWAIGVMGAVGGMGFGVGAILFSAIDWLPYGWRALYAVGFLPMLLLPWLRRDLVETARFEQHRKQRSDGADGFASSASFGSVWALARRQPRRALVLGAVGGLSSLGGIAVFQYASIFVQTVHGWEPWRYAVMIIGGGAIGIIGNVVSGRLGDRLGRRRVGLVAYAGFPLFALLFYGGPEPLLWLAFAGIVFCNSAGEVVTRAFAGELFETGQRGAATGWLMFVNTLGWAVGLFVVGLGTVEMSDLVTTLSLLALCVAMAGACLLAFPETGRRELEEISRDDLAVG
jgi:MFS transporter, putative metabolite:H+ symporter